MTKADKAELLIRSMSHEELVTLLGRMAIYIPFVRAMQKLRLCADDRHTEAR